MSTPPPPSHNLIGAQGYLIYCSWARGLLQALERLNHRGYVCTVRIPPTYDWSRENAQKVRMMVCPPGTARTRGSLPASSTNPNRTYSYVCTVFVGNLVNAGVCERLFTWDNLRGEERTRDDQRRTTTPICVLYISLVLSQRITQRKDILVRPMQRSSSSSSNSSDC